ncbi:MAG: exodeoxyribonuclease VII large subunit [Acidimicrobiales bacterium]
MGDAGPGGTALGDLDREPAGALLSITQLYDRVDGALKREFPPREPIWVRGAIQSISDRTGHCYIDLVEPEARLKRQSPVLKVRCWRREWGALQGKLARAGVVLAEGMVVNLFGSIDFYAARAEVTFRLSGLDVTALLGKMAADRAALITALRTDGLLDANAGLLVPALVVHVGLVASPDTEGFLDFTRQLAGSSFGFTVSVARAAVQGAGAPRAIARGLRRLEASGCDLVVVVRGGGSKGDLVAFDSEEVARAIAGVQIPVWTGIGHSGDESVADVVANRAFPTPTACGHELVARAEAWWQQNVVGPSLQLARRSRVALDDGAGGLRTSRGRLSATARHQVRLHSERLDRRGESIAKGAASAVPREQARLSACSERIVVSTRRSIAGSEQRLASWKRLLGAFDVERQLERGYTLTLDGAGNIVRSARALGQGSLLVSRFADGTATSVVRQVDVDKVDRVP